MNEVLQEIEADEIPVLLVMNKIDKTDSLQPRIERDDEGVARVVWLSAQQNLGIDLLFQALSERLSGTMVKHRLRIPPAAIGRFHSKFCQLRCILREEYDESGHLLIDVRLPQTDWLRLQKREGNELGDFIVT